MDLKAFRLALKREEERERRERQERRERRMLSYVKMALCVCALVWAAAWILRAVAFAIRAWA